MKNRIIFLFTFFILLSCENPPQVKTTDSKNDMTETIQTTLSQADIQSLTLPLLREHGTTYKKFKKIFARRAKADEKISTITSDGLETTNTTNEGDFVVKNQTEAGEEYIMNEKKFNQRYRFWGKAKGGYSEYEPIGKVVALEMTHTKLKQLGLSAEFLFMAPWEEEMVCKENDFLVSPPDFSEVYRIARKEFFETYELEK